MRVLRAPDTVSDDEVERYKSRRPRRRPGRERHRARHQAELFAEVGDGL